MTLQNKFRAYVAICAAIIVYKGQDSPASFLDAVVRFLVTVEGVTLILLGIWMWWWSRPEKK